MARYELGHWVPDQFGPAYSFPREVGAALHAGVVRDTSWGNDAMPRVELSALAGQDESPILWCDSADPEDSEFPTRSARFAVVQSYEATSLLWEGDDVVEALRVLCEAAGGPWRVVVTEDDGAQQTLDRDGRSEAESTARMAVECGALQADVIDGREALVYRVTREDGAREVRS